MRILNAVSVNIRVQYSNRYAIVVVIIGFKKKKKAYDFFSYTYT